MNETQAIYVTEGRNNKKYIHAYNGVFLGETFPKEDGFYDFWPEPGGGYWSAFILRAIADKLDELNAPWQAEIDAYFAEEKHKDDE